MGKETIAEFVENAAILHQLKLPEIGVDYAQGYHIGRPRPICDISQGNSWSICAKSGLDFNLSGL